MKDGNYKIIDGELFEKLVLFGASNLNSNIKIVNDLNVFPIPDGDTGDNMYMTIAGGLSGLKAVKENSICLKAKALAEGMLLNARGNSGVILSQLFAGLANGFTEETAMLEQFVNALKLGVKKAYSSVAKPVEGTILTVARESVDYTAKQMGYKCTFEEFFDKFIIEMQNSLDRTPDLLPVLKDAGVVDSGGAGLLYVVEGMQKAFTQDNLEEIAVTQDQKSIDFSLFNENSVMTFGYCTECLLQLQSSKVDVQAFDSQTIIDFLQTVGDSIVAFKTGTIVKLHVHTLTPYKVLEFCQKFGEFLTIKIENMNLQHSESEKEKQSQTHDFENLKPKKKREHKKFGLVTVATGQGLVDAFTEMGADFVIDGGQGNNPSIETFIQAFDEVDADTIFVLPNNSNIIMAAKQAKSMYNKSQIRVIETKNFGQAYSILSLLDYSSDDAEQIEEEMINGMQEVVTGMITKSIRSTNLNGVQITEGDYIGFTDKTMLVSTSTKIETFNKLADKLCNDKNYIIAVFGKDVTEEEKQSVRDYIAQNKPDLEFYEIDGGQDVYDFILIIE